MIQDIKLKLNGKNHTFSFGILFIGNLIDRLGVNYNEIFTVLGKNMVKNFPLLLFESLKNTYLRDDKDIDFTEKDITNWLNKEPLNGLHLIPTFEQAFIESLNNPTPTDEVESGNVKKK